FNLFIERIEIKPVYGLCNRYKIKLLIFKISFLSRFHFVNDVVCVLSILNLLFAHIGGIYLLKIFCQFFGKPPVACRYIKRAIFLLYKGNNMLYHLRRICWAKF